MGPTRLPLSKPVIAAIEGPAVAGGLELALWCDLRVAASDAVLGVFCRRFGVPLVDRGTINLPRLIGHSRAMDLILTGRGVDGIEAERIGLVNRVTAPGEALTVAVELARELAALPQQCMRNDRRSAIEQWDLDLDAATRNEARRGRATIDSGETVAGASRFAAGAGRHGASGAARTEAVHDDGVDDDRRRRAGAAPGAARSDASVVGAGGDLPHRAARRPRPDWWRPGPRRSSTASASSPCSR